MDEDSIKDEKKRSKWTVLTMGAVWSITALCVVLCGVWIFGGWLYWFDLAAGYTAQAGGLAVVVGSVWWITRHRRAGAVCFVSAFIAFWAVADGRRVVVQKALVGQSSFLIGSYNVYPMNEQWEADIQVLMQLDLDVLILQETPPELNRAIKNHKYLENSPMPNWVHRAWIKETVSTGLILSKYPLEILDPDINDPQAAQQLFCIVHAPGNSFVVGLMHPASPRSAERWEEGNLVVEGHGRQISRILKQTELPMVVGADLNAGPAQLRARRMRKFGLHASKPLLPVASGSFPVGWFGAAQVQIDDVWSTAGVQVVSWGMLESLGSDHKPVIVRLVIH